MSADPFEPREGADPAAQDTPKLPRSGKLLVAWLFLLGLSGFATFEGLVTHVTAGGASMTLLSIVFCLTVVVLLTGAMGLTADYAFGARKHEASMGGRLLSALVYLCCAFLSLTLAFAWWWSMLGAREATDGQIDAQVARVEVGLGQTRQQLGSARDALAQLSVISAERAVTEETQGKTCGAQGRGAGPVHTLRSGSSELFSQISGDAGARIESLDRTMGASLGKIANLRKQAVDAAPDERTAILGEVRTELTGLGSNVSALAGDPGLAAYRLEMDRQAVAFRTPGGHRDLSGNPLTCIDPGIAAALEGASRSLGAIKPMPTLDFEIYEGSKATNEAMRRFVATVVGWVSRETFGEGISGGNEYLAFALGILVDGLLLWVTLRRGADGGGGNGHRLRRASIEIANRRDRREADQLLATDSAIAHAACLVALECAQGLPFPDVIVEDGGRVYLVIPQVASSERSAEMAQSMLRIARQLDRQPRSGVKEQVRFNSWPNRLSGYRERKARASLARLGRLGAAWASGSHFAWFALTDQGLCNLAFWAQAWSQELDPGERADRFNSAPHGEGNGFDTASRETCERWFETTNVR